MILLYIIAGIIKPDFFSMQHIISVLVYAGILGIIALGQTMVILTGGIDLSVAYTMTFGAVVMVTLTSTIGNFPAMVVALIIGLIIGVINGIGVAYIKIPALIMTLAMNNILKSITFVIYDGGGTANDLPPIITKLGKDSVFGIRYVVLFWIVLAVILIIVQNKTTFGRRLFAVGNSPSVAFLSAINDKKTTIGAYVICAVFAVLAGFTLTGVIGYPYLDMGTTYQLSSVAAVVIGGTSIMGGRGGNGGTIAGAVIIYMITSILTVLNIPEAGQNIIYGFVILGVVIMYSRGQRSSEA